MARKRVVSRSAFEYDVELIVANMESMSFEEVNYGFVSVPQLDENEVLERVKKEYGASVKINHIYESEILLSMDEEMFITLAERQDARKKYNNEGAEE